MKEFLSAALPIPGHSFPRSAWERAFGRSASRPYTFTRFRTRDAERPEGAFPRGAWARGLGQRQVPGGRIGGNASRPSSGRSDRRGGAGSAGLTEVSTPVLSFRPGLSASFPFTGSFSTGRGGGRFDTG